MSENKLTKVQIDILQDVFDDLTDYLIDNTIDVFEEIPEIDNARFTIGEFIEKNC